MKTIEKFIKEKIEELFGSDDLENVAGDISNIAEGITIGVKFAQRWIPVDKELPTCNVKILFKDRKNNVHLKTIYSSEYFTDNEIIKEHCRIRSFTHWRPIELK